MQVCIKIFVFCTFLWFHEAIDGQVIYFSIPVDYKNQPSLEFDQSVLASDTGYTILGSSTVNGSTTHLRMYNTDLNGSINWEKQYGKLNHIFFPGKMVNSSNNTLTSCGTIDLPNEDYDAYLFKTSLVGDSIWYKSYGDTLLDDLVEGMIQTNDKGFAIVGNRAHQTSKSSQVLLIKTDSNGNELWQKEYGDFHYDKGYDLIQMDDRGFLICGYALRFITNDRTDRDMYVIRTDSVGNKLWEKMYPGLYYDFGGFVVKSLDGGFLTVGAFNNIHIPRNPPQVPFTIDNIQGLMVKWDDNGSIEWSEEYGPENDFEGGFLDVIQLPDTTYVATGAWEITENSTVNNIDMGWLVKTDRYGKKMWSRTYTLDSSVNHYTWDLDLASDGGFIMCGTSFSNPNSVDQDGWLLKVDSMGCLIPGCDTIFTGIQPPQIITRSALQIYPNPTNGPLLIDLRSIKNQKPDLLTITNINGTVVYSEQLRAEKETHYMDVSNLSSGIYILSVYKDNMLLGSTKVNIQ